MLLVLVGLTHLVEGFGNGVAVDPNSLFHQFLPPHTGGGRDPFALIEGLLTGITERRGELSLVAVPTFLWFSTRLFAGVRTALNDVYDVSARPGPRRGIVATFLRTKLRDIGMVVATLLLFLANVVLSAGLAVLQARSTQVVPELAFWVTTFGRLLGEVLAIAFSVSLFFVMYKYASLRRLPWSTALLGATFTAVAFELAKRLYGLYLGNFAASRNLSGDATLGALGLFVLWLYYTAIVFLVGGVVAETWELRRMQRKQRAILA